MGQLRANKFDVEHESSSKRSIVIINTCGFIDNGKTEISIRFLNLQKLNNKELIN